MKIPAIIVLVSVGLAAAAAAQGASSGKASSPGGPSKSQFSEIRSLVHDLQGRTEKLYDLMTQYRAHAGERPQGDQGQLAKWEAALERLMRRVDETRAAVAETTQRLDQSISGQTLPTALGKDVANARNEAEAQRTAAEQALAKNKATAARASKRAKQKPEPEKEAPPIPDDL